MSKKNNELLCIAPNCDREVYARGLCNSHYNMATRLISEGRKTWAELEASGKVLPIKGKQGARDGSMSWFLDESREENIQE